MAFESETDIVNMALARLGVRAFVNSLDDPTPEAETAKRLYRIARDTALEMYSWPFAKRRQALALLATTPPTGWGFFYALPDDCLAPHYIYPGTRVPTSSQLIPFKLYYDSVTQKVALATDAVNPELSYTMRLTIVTLFPPSFGDAVACKLAADMAAPLTGKLDLRGELLKEYKFLIGNAITMATQSEEPDGEPDSEFITKR
jgi:hypothetical protein